METGILSALLNWYCQYNILITHDHLLNMQFQTMPSCMCSSLVVSPSDSVC